MVTTVGVYEGFGLHLRIPLLVQDDVNHNEMMVESSITEINHTELENLHSQATAFITGGVINIGGFLLASEIQPQHSMSLEMSKNHHIAAITNNAANATLPRATSQTLRVAS